MAEPRWTKVAGGHYRTADGDFEIKRVLSLRTGRRTEVVWEIVARGTTIRCEESMRDAKGVVSRYY